ncbi:MAG: oligosaccharide flippase family protein [Clostridia bacterium]
MEGLLKKLGQFSIGPIVGALIGFITVPIITYFISPEEYGKSSMFTLAISILQLFVFLGMDQAYTKRYYETVNRSKLLTNAIFPAFILVMAIDLGLFLGKGKVAELLFGSSEEIICVYALIIILPGLAIEKFALMDIRMQQRGVLYSVMSILLKTLTLICIVTLFVQYQKSFRAIVFGTTVAQLLYSGILLFCVRKSFIIRASLLDWLEIKSLLKFGLPIVPVSIIGWALSGMDKVMLRGFCDYSELGMYEVAFKVVNIIGIAQTCFTSFWVPVAHQWNNDNVDKERFVYIGRLISLAMTGIFVLVLLFKNVIFFILADDYGQAVNIVPFLLIYPIMYTVSEVTVMGIYFKEKTLNLLFVSLAASIVNIALNCILIPKAGAIGASIATGVSYTVFFWIRTLISRRIWFKFPVKEYIFITAILFVLSFCNIWIHGIGVYIINCCSIPIIVYYFRNELKDIFHYLKNASTTRSV